MDQKINLQATTRKSETIITPELGSMLISKSKVNFESTVQITSITGLENLINLGQKNIGKEIEFKFIVFSKNFQHSYKVKFESPTKFKISMFDNESFVAL
jgi:hypothetical protein